MTPNPSFMTTNPSFPTASSMLDSRSMEQSTDTVMDALVCSNDTPTAVQQWESQNELVVEVLKYLDVPTLDQTMLVGQRWSHLCTVAITSKCSNRPKAFDTKAELRDAVHKYTHNNPNNAEALATTYGWPIGKWNVSQIQDFSHIFFDCDGFNEDISLWDTSSATDMKAMFWGVSSFNQPLSDWDTSNVTDMSQMFAGASSFNQPLSSWDTSSVRYMSGMFRGASSFNQLSLPGTSTGL